MEDFDFRLAKSYISEVSEQMDVLDLELSADSVEACEAKDCKRKR